MNMPEPSDKAIYTGNSMRGLFVPGETLCLAEKGSMLLQNRRRMQCAGGLDAFRV